VIDRTLQGIRRHGPAGSVRIAARNLRHAASGSAHEGWHLLRLDDPDRPRRELPGDLRLRAAGGDDLDYAAPALAEDVSRAMIERRLARGGRLWLVEDDNGPAFTCWIFEHYTPSAVAPGERLDLPAGTVGLEDSYTAPDFRGRGVAPAAWTAIADLLAAEGVQAIATPVDEENAPSRRGVEKAGFKQVAVAHMERRSFRTRVRVEGEGDFAVWVRDHVQR
jgi:RimJ/RimL family protein N-acetyltransferase